MQFNYMYQTEAMGSIDITDIGNFALNVTDSFFRNYYLIVVTKGGLTGVLTYGPVIDGDIPASKSSCSFEKFEYQSRKIEKIVDKFLNITTCAQQAMVIEIQDAILECKNLVEYL